uniref:Uncharacterized protein n=1 Tax=Acrobeloides nanus TaxID=290746 RepID=A0A914CBK3_9BILA
MLGDSVVLFIVGNKIDLNERRTVGSSEAEEYAKSVKAEYRETSAKEDTGVIPLFEDLVISMLEKSKERIEEVHNTTLRRHGSRRSIRVVDEQPKPSRKCC